LDEVIRKEASLPDDARPFLREMLTACRTFLDELDELPLKVRRDGATPISQLERQYIDIIEYSLYEFRDRFTLPLIRLLSAYQVDIPMNVLIQTPLEGKSIPKTIFFKGLPLDSAERIHFAGESHTGHYLRFAKLSEPTSVSGVQWPVGTELFFHDPIPTGKDGQVTYAKVGSDMVIDGRSIKMGETVYLDFDGLWIEKEIKFENRYDFLDRKRQQRSKNQP
jgi:hypothetical protein